MGGPDITRRFFLLGGAAVAIGCSKNGDHSSSADALMCPVQLGYPWFNVSNMSTTTPVQYFPSMENAGGDIYVAHDAGGLFAMAVWCTYDSTRTCIASATVCSPDGERFLCPSCDSRYALDGSVIAGPATKPLQHLAMCVSGGVYVNLAEPADQSARL